MNRLVTFACLLLLGTPAFAADLAVRGQVIHTAAGEPIENGVILVENGKITAIGSLDTVDVPDGVTTLTAAVVTPGLIDAHTVVGLSGYLNQPHDQDQLEVSAAIQPELRAIDAYNTREPLVSWLRSHGVTTIHTGHGPGEIISGQTMIAKTRGNSVAEATIREVAMVAATISDSALVSADESRKSPGTRGKVAAMLRSSLVQARNYRTSIESADGSEDGQPPGRDLKLEVLGRVLDGELPLLVTAQRHNDILTALRIAGEFDIKMVLDGAAESYLVMQAIEAAGVPVILHPQMARPIGELENVSYTTAGQLINTGIPVAFQSGYESYVPKTRVVLFEAGMTLPYGLAFEQALAAITIESARILGIDDRVGSLEVGKDADLALFDSDPFEHTSHVLNTIIEGEVFD